MSSTARRWPNTVRAHDRIHRPQGQQARIRDKIDAGIQRVLARGQYILDPEVDELDERLVAYTGSKYCITVANGTDALQIAQVTIATAETVALLGTKPMYVDIDRVPTT